MTIAHLRSYGGSNGQGSKPAETHPPITSKKGTGR